MPKNVTTSGGRLNIIEPARLEACRRGDADIVAALGDAVAPAGLAQVLADSDGATSDRLQYHPCPSRIEAGRSRSCR